MDRKLVVCVGPGGVGKTTVAAAMALGAARAGKRALVLTVDPARRLADALGAAELGDAIVQVQVPGICGELHASMVESAASYDALITRITPDEATATRILENEVYRAVRRSLARSHAYVAMERLYDATENHRFDLIVLDTPPARHALEILDAPAHLARFLELPIVGWLLPRERHSLRARLWKDGGAVAQKLLAKVTGATLLDGLLGFLALFAELRPGFVHRAERVASLLRENTTAFALVTSASASAAGDATWLRDDLRRRGVGIDAVVFNRSYAVVDVANPERVIERAPSGDLAASLARMQPHLPPAHGDVAFDPRQTLVALRSLRTDATHHNAICNANIHTIEAGLPGHCIRVRVPELSAEIHDVSGLHSLADCLLA